MLNNRTFLYSILILSFFTITIFGQQRPNVAYPVFNNDMSSISKLSKSNQVYSGVFSDNVIQNGADRLTSKQYTDGSWGWPLDAPPTYGNIVGPIAMGLAKAYYYMDNPGHLTALSNAGAYLLTKTNNFSPSDGYLAATLDQIFGGTTYRQYLIDNYYGPLAAGTYNRNGAGTLYNTATYVALISTNRHNAGQGNLAAWDIGMGLVGAAMCGASTTEWIDGVKAEINELVGGADYDVIGLAGALYGLAYVGEEFDPTAGQHAAAGNLQDLADTLALYQISSGGFAWRSDYVIPNDQDEAIQETAYAMLALAKVNSQRYSSNIVNAGNYTMSVQLPSGGWEDYTGAGENNEITGEALWGMSVSIEKQAVTATGNDYMFPVNGVTLNFSTLPAGGGDVTIQRYNKAPDGFPGNLTNLDLWLDFGTSMTDFTFNVTVKVDVDNISGFDANTTVMYYNGSSWLAIAGGTYMASDPALGGHASFTFTTNHFTPFTFINTPATAYNVYLSTSTTAAAATIYPNTDWGVTAYDPNDWDFTTPVTLYIVPEVGSTFGACDVTIQWDNSMFSFGGVDNVGIFSGYNLTFFQNQLGSTTQITINASRTDNHNFSIAAGNYIAKLNLNLLKPGYGAINFTGMDFRTFDGSGGQNGVYVIGNGAQVKAYLGDVATTGDQSTGDGKLDINDLTLWAGSYWSGVPGYGPGMTNYKVKYDVGPTADNTVYTLPQVDGKIQFEDLVIFAISYGLSGDNIYPKVAPVPEEPVELKISDPIYSGNETLVPVLISGAVQDVRAITMSFSGQFGKLLGVDKGDLLKSSNDPSLLLNRTDNKNIFVDLAVVGANAKTINGEGQLCVLRFEGKANVNLNSAVVRNSGNNNLLAKVTGNKNAVPTIFALSQNYPNPFNPVTRIDYQVPQQSQVEIVVFNSLGQKVATLVNEVKETGAYSVDWNAASLSSGVYFYQMKAGDFVTVKKLVLLK